MCMCPFSFESLLTSGFPDSKKPMASVKNSPKVERKNQDEVLSPTSQKMLDDLMMPIDRDLCKTKENAEDDASNEKSMKVVDSVDGSIVSTFLFDVDRDINGKKTPAYKVQLYSCNQQSGHRKGYFLQMKLDDVEESGLKITTNGTKSDPHAMWTAYYALDTEKRQILVLENEECSRLTGKTCVIGTQKVVETNDYILKGMKIDSIPESFINIDPKYGFFKKPKAMGSELLYLKSLLGSEEKKLLVGFDGEGEALPLNKVKKYSSDFQAFFRIIPGQYH